MTRGGREETFFHANDKAIAIRGACRMKIETLFQIDHADSPTLVP
jgi:hypothetical protein